MIGRVRSRIRDLLGVVSQDQMNGMQKHFQQKEQAWENRLTKLEATAKFSNQFHMVSKGMDFRLAQLEQSAAAGKSSNCPGPFPKPRSLVRLGVRVTLSDGFWSHVGTDCVDEIDDHLIETLIQGPFCPVCLKRVVARDRHKNPSEIPIECRYCGVSWDDQGTFGYPLPLLEFKRRVYEKLDHEYRAGGRIL